MEWKKYRTTAQAKRLPAYPCHYFSNRPSLLFGLRVDIVLKIALPVKCSAAWDERLAFMCHHKNL